MFYLQHEEVKLVRQTLVYFGECIKLHKAFSSFVPVVLQMVFSVFRRAEEECLLSKMIK